MTDFNSNFVSSGITAMEVATGRSHSIFKPDLDANAGRIQHCVSNKRILAIGAAGSIGSHTVKVLAGFGPAALHIVDQNENELTELVRQFRSAPEEFAPEDFRTLPIDYGSNAMAHFLASEAPYDMVLNFAALKHVRSEKDPFSTLQMFDTNIVKQANLIGLLRELNFTGRYFSVSTDKAANPSSLMGATKRAMEHVMFDEQVTIGFGGVITSARFANVAFSNGSLLQSFENRFARGEPIACPKGIRRYFVSLRESGEICTLASTLLPHRSIGIPDLDPSKHLVPLEDIARAFITSSGYNPKVYEDEKIARQNVSRDLASGNWPLILTPADTAGEKPYEEFIGKHETCEEVGLNSMKRVPYLASQGSVKDAIKAVQVLSQGMQNAPLNKDVLKNIIAHLEPAFLETHRDSNRNLDQRA